MFETGKVRGMDDLGRIVIPKDVRKQLDLKEGDRFEIYIDKKNKMVCFKKYDLEDKLKGE